MCCKHFERERERERERETETETETVRDREGVGGTAGGTDGQTERAKPSTDQ